MTYPPVDDIVLSDVQSITPPPPTPAAAPMDLKSMVSSMHQDIRYLPENIRNTLREERTFKELSPNAVSFMQTHDPNTKNRVQAAEREIEFRHVTASIFSTYDYFEPQLIYDKLNNMSELICYHAKRIYKTHIFMDRASREKVEKLRYQVVFAAISWYLRKRGLITDEITQYAIISPIVDNAMRHTPRHIKVQRAKKHSYYY